MQITSFFAVPSYVFLVFGASGRDVAGMSDAFAGTIYVVVASNGEQSEFWAAATPRARAAAAVRQLLPHGWTAKCTGWSLSPDKTADLRMCANSVRKLRDTMQ